MTRLLNPAYVAIHRATRGAKVGGGVTAPRGSTGGVSPVAWIRGMGAAKARLDAYAHNPYPLKRFETPWIGGCGHCETITMATLERLQREVWRAFGSLTRIWLTEYGYQTNPPDRALGVSRTLQARYVGEGAYRAFVARNVDMLIQYLYQDEPDIGRWQSGYVGVGGGVKLVVPCCAAAARAGFPHRRPHRAVGAGAVRQGAAAVRPPAVPGRRLACGRRRRQDERQRIPEPIGSSR